MYHPPIGKAHASTIGKVHASVIIKKKKAT
jgi:hypothetical protein